MMKISRDTNLGNGVTVDSLMFAMPVLYAIKKHAKTKFTDKRFSIDVIRYVIEFSDVIHCHPFKNAVIDVGEMFDESFCETVDTAQIIDYYDYYQREPGPIKMLTIYIIHEKNIEIPVWDIVHQLFKSGVADELSDMDNYLHYEDLEWLYEQYKNIVLERR